MDVRRKQLLSFLACPFALTLRGGCFRPRHLNRYIATLLSAETSKIIRHGAQIRALLLPESLPPESILKLDFYLFHEFESTRMAMCHCHLFAIPSCIVILANLGSIRLFHKSDCEIPRRCRPMDDLQGRFLLLYLYGWKTDRSVEVCDNHQH